MAAHIEYTPPFYVSNIPSDPLLFRLSELKESCTKIRDVLRTLDREILTWKPLLGPTLVDSWFSTDFDRQVKVRERCESTSKFIDCCQRYEQISPDLLRQVKDIKLALGIQRFDRFDQLMEGSINQKDYLSLRTACRNLDETAVAIVKLAESLFSHLRSMHRSYNEAAAAQHALPDAQTKKRTFTDCTDPKNTFSSEDFPFAAQEVSRFLQAFPMAPPEPLPQLSVPVDMEPVLTKRFTEILDRVLEEQKQINRAKVLSS